MSEYPNLKRAGWWLVSQALPTTVVMTIIFLIGYHRGHDAGRIEMKCAIFAIVERLGEGEPAPGTITLGCDKTPSARARETGSAAA